MITVDEHDRVSVVRLAHGKVNLLDLDLLVELENTFRRLAGVEALVLTGEGRAFSAGVDLRLILDGGRDYVAAFLPALTGVFRTVFNHPRPVVAAVNGHAIAGGCILVAASDWRLMSGGTIGVTELLVGLPFPPSALEAMRFALGPAAARLILTGQQLSPSDALAVGLVDEVVEADSLLDHALERARQFARVPTDTFSLTKSQLRSTANERIAADDLAYMDRLVEAWTSPQLRDAIARYLDQLAARPARPPGD